MLEKAARRENRREAAGHCFRQARRYYEKAVNGDYSNDTLPIEDDEIPKLHEIPKLQEELETLKTNLQRSDARIEEVTARVESLASLLSHAEVNAGFESPRSDSARAARRRPVLRFPERAEAPGHERSGAFGHARTEQAESEQLASLAWGP